VKPQAGDADTHHTHRCVKALIPHLIRRVCSATTKTPPGSAAQTRAVASLGGGTIFDSQPCCFKSSAPGQFLSSFSAAAHLIPIIPISHPYFPPYPYPPSPSPSPPPPAPLASGFVSARSLWQPQSTSRDRQSVVGDCDFFGCGSAWVHCGNVHRCWTAGGVRPINFQFHTVATAVRPWCPCHDRVPKNRRAGQRHNAQRLSGLGSSEHCYIHQSFINRRNDSATVFFRL
jgi:hypothetical protein